MASRLIIFCLVIRHNWWTMASRHIIFCLVICHNWWTMASRHIMFCLVICHNCWTMASRLIIFCLVIRHIFTPRTKLFFFFLYVGNYIWKKGVVFWSSGLLHSYNKICAGWHFALVSSVYWMFCHYEWFESPCLYLIAVDALSHPHDNCSCSRLCTKKKVVEGKANSRDLFGMDSHCYQH